MDINKVQDKIVSRFLDYVKIDTQSARFSGTFPSTSKQFDLAKVLASELKELGLSDVTLDENAYVTATLESNLLRDTKTPVIGFIAHLDTAPDLTGKNVKPIIHKKYGGGDIDLGNGTVIKVAENPLLHKYIGEDIITSDGTTLLGIDDKAAIAEIMGAMEYFKLHPELKHGTIKIVFSPDEEVGNTFDRFDMHKYGAKYSYTLDGYAEMGEINNEWGNSGRATFKINGKCSHTGDAKGKMVNSIKIASQLVSMFPQDQAPETTEGDQGYFHIYRISGVVVEETELNVIFADFNIQGLEKQKELLRSFQNQLNEQYGNGTIELSIKNRNTNPKQIFEQHPDLLSITAEAVRRAGYLPKYTKIRHGTDGCIFTAKGIPTLNLPCGGHNFHSRTEYIPITNLLKCTEILVNIIILFGQKYT